MDIDVLLQSQAPNTPFHRATSDLPFLIRLSDFNYVRGRPPSQWNPAVSRGAYSFAVSRYD